MPSLRSVSRESTSSDAGVKRNGVIVLRRLRDRQLQDQAAQGLRGTAVHHATIWCWTPRPSRISRGSWSRRSRRPMTRVVGIDPGTVSIDVCGTRGRPLYLDRSWPTAEALADPRASSNLLSASGPPDLIAGPSGYGLPLRRCREATEADLRLAFLAAPEESRRHRRAPRPCPALGGLGTARGLHARGHSSRYRARAPEDQPGRPGNGRQAVRRGARYSRPGCQRSGVIRSEVSFILLELGGAFTAGVAVEQRTDRGRHRWDQRADRMARRWRTGWRGGFPGR